MRKTLLLTCVGALGLAGAAYAATTVTNDYVIAAKVTPKKSGTQAHPRTVARYLQWDVSTAPPGRRPANTRGYQIGTVGLQQNTTNFPGCGTSKLAATGPAGCPRGSMIGSGFAIIEVGPTGQNNSSYNGLCRADEDLFNGGSNNETLYVFKGPQHGGEPAPCPIPNGHAEVNINLTRQATRMIETFSLPEALLHPAPGTDASIVHEAITIPPKSRTVRRGHGTARSARRVGLFESVYCPANGQRQVAITFTREDGIAQTRTTLVPCTGSSAPTPHKPRHKPSYHCTSHRMGQDVISICRFY
jgi:hypothetical protein